jgi:hypothetical protein
VDQGLSATANLLGTVLVARWGSLDTLGVFGVAFAFYLAGLGLVRAAVGDPLVVAGGDMRHLPAIWAPAWLVLVPSMVVGSALTAMHVGVAAVVSFALPALFLQSSLRYLAFAQGRPDLAVLLDGTWVLSMTAGALLVVGASSATSAAATWALGGALAAVVGVLVFGCVPPGPSDALGSLTELGRGLSRPLMAESVAFTATSTLLIPLALAAISLSYAGYFRAAAVICGPLTVALTAWELYSFPAISRAPEDQYRGVASRNSWFGFLLGCGLLLLILAVNQPLQAVLLAGGVTVPVWIIAAVGVVPVVSALAAGALGVLKRWRRGDRLLLARLWSLGPGVLIVGAGLLTSSAVLVLVAPVVSAAAFAVLGWVRVINDASALP